MPKTYTAGSLRILAAGLAKGHELSPEARQTAGQALADFANLLDPPPPITPAELKARRIALGLSQLQLAEKLGHIRQTITRWENGKRGIPASLDSELRKIE